VDVDGNGDVDVDGNGDVDGTSPFDGWRPQSSCGAPFVA